MKTLRLLPGVGYWDVSYFPIGGAFRRANSYQPEILSYETFSPKCHGCNAYGITKGGMRIAFNLDNTETLEEV